jgi:hypothetical protein
MLLLHPPLILEHPRQDIRVNIIHIVASTSHAVGPGTDACRTGWAWMLLVLMHGKALLAVAVAAASVIACDGVEELIHDISWFAPSEL